MITVNDALTLLETLATGIKPSEGYLRPASEKPPLPSGRMLAAQVLAATFNAAGIPLDQAQLAVLSYLGEPDTTQYPKPWPDPGKLMARTSTARDAQLTESREKSEASSIFHAVMTARSSYGADYRGPVVNIIGREGDAGLEVAIQAGIAALGGWRALGSILDTERGYRARDFGEAFVGARERARTVKGLGTVERLRLVAK